MIPIFFVGDGARDHVTMPRLVEKILGVPIREHAAGWARLNETGDGKTRRLKGYALKLRFAVEQARDAGAIGLVATVDADKDPRRQKLRKLRDGRDQDRASAPPFPTALGEAVPHAEAWLLDDAVAVRRAMRLPADVPISTVRQTNSAKQELQMLLAKSPRASQPILEVWADIARQVDVSRCQHGRETGFDCFSDDVRQELGPFRAR